MNIRKSFSLPGLGDNHPRYRIAWKLQANPPRIEKRSNSTKLGCFFVDDWHNHVYLYGYTRYYNFTRTKYSAEFWDITALNQCKSGHH